MAKSTDELMEILKSEPDIGHFIEENTEEIICVDLRDYIVNLLQEKKLTVAKVSSRGQMSGSYLYKLNQGVKENPSRNKVIQMCFGFELDAEESQRFINVAGVGKLYPRVRRDSIILFCLENHIEILECDRMLEEAVDKTILKE